MKTMQSKIKKKKISPILFVLPFIVLYAGFFIFPLINSFRISLHDWQGFGDNVFVGFNNYVRLLLKDKFFLKSILNVLIIQLMTLPPVLIISSITANLLFNLKKARRFFQTVNFLPYILTPVAIGLIFSLLFSTRTGVVNNLFEMLNLQKNGPIDWLGEPNLVRIVLALSIIWKYLGFHIVVYLSAISTIPQELYEAANVAGATKTQIFRKITLPLLKPITFFLILTDLIGGFQMFDEPSRLLATASSGQIVGGPDRAILTPVWYLYDVTFGASSQLGYGAAIGFALFSIIIVFSIFSFKLRGLKGRKS